MCSRREAGERARAGLVEVLKNTAERFGAVTKVLHWLLAALIFGLVALGWWMVDLTYYDPWYNRSLSLHKSLGMLALLLGAAKVAWTIYSRPPPPGVALEAWERAAARTVHLVLFAMMVLVPATGYLISTSAGDPVSVFGWLEIPALFPENEAVRDAAIGAHYYLAYATAVLAAGHAAAALKHQLVDRDGTLLRML